jgi:hypothetical protein
MSSVTMTNTRDANRFKLSLFTGPTLVRQIAARLREAGVTVLIEGTERVIVEVEGTDSEDAKGRVLVALVRKHGTDFDLRPRLA